MRQNKPMKKEIETIKQINFRLISISVMCVFVYLVMLGLTATNIVSAKTVSKSVEDKKTELATAEVDYMSTQNIVAIETNSNSDFVAANSISYVNEGIQNQENTVAFAREFK